MNAQHRKKALLAGVAGLVLAFTNVVGCSDGDNDAPSDPTVTGGTANVGGSNGSGGKNQGSGGTEDGAGGSDGSGAANGTDGGADNNASGGSENNGSGGEGATGPVVVECDPEQTEDECWTCPEETEQFLNQCNSSNCEHFDNDARLPHLNEDGSLPELP